MYRGQCAGIQAIIFLAGLVVIGCVEVERVLAVAAVPPDRTACDTEAQQLIEAVAVYPAPKPGLAPFAKLERGRFVFRCELSGEWLGVMFPAMGEKVDCAERQPERACSFGWIHRETKMGIFG